MKVLIRVDASTAIGSGHVMRCLTLANRLKKENNDIYFVMRDLAGNLIELVEKAGFAVFILPRAKKQTDLNGYEKWLTVKVATDAAETLSVVREKLGTVDRVIVDSYAIDYRWEGAMREVAKEIMVIDDLANRRHDADILLDQNFYLDKDTRYNGLVPANCKLLLGPENALLREEFYTEKKRLRQRDVNIKNILVFYGGSDLTDETTKAIQALVILREKYRADFTVTVVVGLSNARREKIKNLCQKYSYIKYLCQVNNMAELMNKADLMLGAGGSTTWERLFLKVPALVTAVADNQVQGAIDCASAGIIDYLGLAADVTVDTIITAIKEKYLQRS